MNSIYERNNYNPATMRPYIDPQTGRHRNIGVSDLLDTDTPQLIIQHDQTLTQELLKVIRPEYQAKANVKTWYATLHIAGNIDVAKAFIQKRILNEGACYQVTECDYLYTGGCEQGMTIRCIHYPRFREVTPEILLENLMKLANELAKELGQKSYTIETSDRTTYFDNGNKNG